MWTYEFLQFSSAFTSLVENAVAASVIVIAQVNKDKKKAKPISSNSNPIVIHPR